VDARPVTKMRDHLNPVVRAMVARRRVVHGGDNHRRIGGSGAGNKSGGRREREGQQSYQQAGSFVCLQKRVQPLVSWLTRAPAFASEARCKPAAQRGSGCGMRTSRRDRAVVSSRRIARDCAGAGAITRRLGTSERGDHNPSARRGVTDRVSAAPRVRGRWGAAGHQYAWKQRGCGRDTARNGPSSRCSPATGSGPPGRCHNGSNTPS